MFKKLMGFIALILIIVLGGYYFYPEKKLPVDISIDSLIVLKSERKLLAYSNGELIKIYKISLGRNPVGAKEIEGDKKTPEGIYYIKDKNPNSGYHKNLGISYPVEKDIKKAKELGKPPGGDIKIHGLRNGTGFIGKCHRWVDWTLGCIAVTNKEIDELYNAVKIGSKIEIRK